MISDTPGRGGEGGQKKGKFLRTSFMDGPLLRFIIINVSLSEYYSESNYYNPIIFESGLTGYDVLHNHDNTLNRDSTKKQHLDKQIFGEEAPGPGRN